MVRKKKKGNIEKKKEGDGHEAIKRSNWMRQGTLQEKIKKSLGTGRITVLLRGHRGD